MSSSYDSTVNAFYLAYYGRPADPAGLQYWSQQLDQAGGDFSAIVTAFSTSAEATARFGADDATQRITAIYDELFDRAPDAAGLAYWLNALDKGGVTMADVAIQIAGGATSTDADLAALRTQAAASFTAAVQAGGVHYDGLAAIEAAQVLIKAVTLVATPADIATIVSETAKLVDTAYTNPAVLTALATGTTLTALFDTVRGSADPVGLVRTLADVGVVAAGNADTLDSLLRGGGMQKVLTVMPASATLTDVVNALATGGMPAAVEVVYPTATAPAAAAVSFSFKSVTEGELDSSHDNVTNQSVADVTFSYSGSQLSKIGSFEYSTDGGQNWTSTGISADSTTKTVTLDGVALGHVIYAGLPFHVNTALPTDVTTTIYVRALDTSGAVISPASHADVVFDSYVPAPQVELAVDTAGANLGTGYDGTTSNPAYTVTAEAGAKIEYALIDPNASNQTLTWSDVKPVLQEGANDLYVRVTDAAGNTNERELTYSLDTSAPAAPTVALVSDTGSSHTDKVTNVAQVAIGGLAATVDDTAWEYRIDNGAWLQGSHIDGSGAAVLDLAAVADPADGVHTVDVRQYDAAGNTSTASSLTFTLDTTAPATALHFVSIAGADAGVATTAQTTPDVTFGYDTLEQGAHVEWSTDGVTWHADGITVDSAQHTVTVAAVDMTATDLTVQMHAVDAAGNIGSTAVIALDSTANDAPVEPEVSNVYAVSVNMAGSPGIVYLGTGPQTIVQDNAAGASHGFADAASLIVQDLSTGTATATSDNLTDGSQFNVMEGAVRLDTAPAIDLYGMTWSDATFLTDGASGAGYVAAGSVMFAGGQNGQVVETGFGLDEMVMVHGDIDRSGSSVNTAFIDDGDAVATIVTGMGNNLISDNGGTLTIVHNDFYIASHDVILGFDTGNDKIELGNGAAAVDRNGDGVIQWSGSSVVGAASEAVEATLTGPIITHGGDFDSYDTATTVATLNDTLDVSAVAQGTGLLILAESGSNGALLYYSPSDSNGKIDADELTFVDVFANGAVHAADVTLVGVSGGGIPGG